MVQIKTKYMDVDGEIERSQYLSGDTALYIGRGTPDQETLSINLASYGLMAPDENHVYVKNYAEHKGLAEALEKAGVATPVKIVTYGPFDTTATLMKLEN